MPAFTPIRPNYFTRSQPSNSASVLASQGASDTYMGNFYKTTRSKPVPGATINPVNRSPSSNISLGATVNSSGFAVGASIDTGPVSVGVTYATNGYAGTNDLSLNRLTIAGIPFAGVYRTGIGWSNIPEDTLDVYAAFNEATETRVIISDQTQKFIEAHSNFAPLKETGGVLFPYTPVIQISHKANYDTERLIHTNYTTPYFTSSNVDSINIQGRFTAQTPDDANYVLAMMHFFKTATKMFYGASSNRGTPPPVLYLDGHGQTLLDHIPIVITDFGYTLPNEVHYIQTVYLGRDNQVPVDLNVNITAMPVYSRNRISNDFNLDTFASGGLLTSGSGPRKGGWI